jgi:lysophospholipase L1-like esterase
MRSAARRRDRTVLQGVRLLSKGRAVNINRTVLAVALTTVAVVFAVSWGEAEPRNRPIKREGTEWCDVWMPDSNQSNAPRVLLIGDSITRGYFPAVESLLQGKASCARLSTSKSVGDPALATEITAFLSESKYDVIHFNNGMHGWDYTEAEYRQYLPEMLRAIRQAAPRAKLIWASTTPVRADIPAGPSNTRIDARNAIASNFFQRQGIPIDDLHALMSTHGDLHSDDVHYNDAGYAVAAKQVADQILAVLPATRNP